MRRLSFVATECGSDGDALCGASNARSTDEHHTFVVAGDPSATGDGAYFELDDEIQGGDGLINAAVVSGDVVELVLASGQTTVPFDVVHVVLPTEGRAAFVATLAGLLGRRCRRC